MASLLYCIGKQLLLFEIEPYKYDAFNQKSSREYKVDTDLHFSVFFCSVIVLTELSSLMECITLCFCSVEYLNNVSPVFYKFTVKMFTRFGFSVGFFWERICVQTQVIVAITQVLSPCWIEGLSWRSPSLACLQPTLVQRTNLCLQGEKQHGHYSIIYKYSPSSLSYVAYKLIIGHTQEGILQIWEYKGSFMWRSWGPLQVCHKGYVLDC